MCRHQTLNFFAGLVSSDLALQRSYFEKAAATLPQSTYPKFVAFMVTANLGKAVHDTRGSAELQKTCDDQSLAALRDALAVESFAKSEMSVLRWRLGMAMSAQDLFDRRSPQFCEILDQSPHVEPWVADYFEGLRAIDDAWRARGSGWARTVKPEGWKGFEEEIALARDHLEKSWTANPHDPAAAASMIKVAMAESEERETMRVWLDRSLAAQIDYGPAFDAIFWGLRPRWLGNHAEMIQIGRECAATKRYDTLLPYQFLYALRSIATDGDDTETIYHDPELNRAALSVLDGYLAAPDPALNANYTHTYAAIIAYKGQQLDLAKKHLAAIDWKPSTNVDLNRLESLPALVAKLRP